MDDDRLLDLARAVAGWLRPRLERDAEARRLAALVGHWLCDEAERAGQIGAMPATGTATPVADTTDTAEAADKATVGEPSTPAGPSPDERAAVDDPASDRGPGRTPRVTSAWTIGDVVGENRDRAEPPPEVPEIDLDLLGRRCRLKAASCLTAIVRRQATDDPATLPAVIDRIDEHLAQAKAMPGCFLWALFRDRPQPDDDTLIRIAACYEALAASAELVALLDRDDTADLHALRAAFADMAEASSSLRVALVDTWLTSPDRDQDEAHVWLRGRVTERGLFLPRYMRLDDPGDPAAAPGLTARVVERRRAIETRAARQDDERNHFRRVHHHVRRIDGSNGMAEEHDLRRIAEAVHELCALGLMPSDRRFRAAIPSQVAALVLPLSSETARDVFERLSAPAEPDAAAAGSDGEGVDDGASWSATVQRVREILSGRRVVVVGGVPRVEAIGRLEDAFGLARVDWVSLTEHGSADPLRAPIAHPDTALVLVLVKLTGHHHADAAKALARAAGKPCVFLPAGYNPEQVADVVWKQASDQLNVADPIRQTPARGPDGFQAGRAT